MRSISKDVVVIGAGFAGLGAAIAAARSGANVCLIEASNQIGGVMSTCPNMPIGAAYPSGFSIGGILDEFVQKLLNMNPPKAEKRDCSLIEFGPEIVYDYEYAISTLNTMLIEANVELLKNTMVMEPILNEEKITGVSCVDRNGAVIVLGKVFIDCSGDGDVAYKAGVPCQLGDENGNMMGASLVFSMINVDWDKVNTQNDDPYFRKYTQIGIKKGLLHPDLEKLYILKGLYSDQAVFNSVIIRDVDGTHQESVTNATNEGRKRSFELIDFVRKLLPGFENARLNSMGASVGIRETRKFEAMYYLQGEDLVKATKFPDGVVACDNPVDDVFRGTNQMTHDAIVEKGSYYTIPFRAMVPKTITNLLFAGRLISADPIAFASIRGMSQCMLMGQACGVAAVMASSTGTPVQKTNTEELIKVLIKQGVNGLISEV